MDLIYTDATWKDLGVLEAYSIDMAYGGDENDFECTIDRSDHCCGKGSLIYAEGTEYGGIVDRIAIDTEADEITYKGRTWHGVLAKKILVPDPGEDYLILQGEANTVLQELITRTGLSDLFTASQEDSGIEISGFQMDRFIDAYAGIRKMLKAAGAKLHMEWKTRRVELSAQPVMDYSQDEEFDSSQINYAMEQNYLPTNHIVCMGQGELADRHVIHIFTDENGGVQPYADTDPPLQDSDYILDESGRVLSGADEVVETLDYSSAETVTNYILLPARPSDWADRCESYYEMDGESYRSVDKEEVGYVIQKIVPYDWSVNFHKYYTRSSSGSADTYTAVSGTTAYEVLTARPSDWATKYGSYFTRSGSTYTAVEAVVTETYTRQTKKPKDWWTKYDTYFVFYTDGVTSEYKAVEGVEWYEYKLQTRKPTDWEENHTSYYRRATAAELKARKWEKYKAVEKVTKKVNQNGKMVEQQVTPTWKARTYYTRYTHKHAPDWSEAVRYTYKKTLKAPAWTSGTYYEKNTSAPPAWTAGTYYTKSDEKVAPAWTTNKYYRQVFDHYATMVAGAIERLQEAHMSEPMEISLEETEQIYDVGDYTGAVDQQTGIRATQEITKKIIKINNDDIRVTYEVK